jgi:phage gpG-like protein
VSIAVVGDKEVIERFQRLPDSVRESLRRAVQDLAVRLQHHVAQDKLSGQVLNVRSGKLSRSIDQVVLQNGDEIVGVVSTSVKYARIHEYGGVIKQRERTATLYRSIDKDGNFKHNGRFVSKSKSNFATDHAMGARVITMPERSFLRSSLRDMRQQIVQGLRAAAHQGMRS